MKLRANLLALAFAAIALAGCSKEDTEPPEINVKKPADHSHFHPGDEMHLHAVFTDNKALGEYRIDIHPANGHAHGKRNSEWEEVIIGELEGTEEVVALQMDIPEDAEPGTYHMVVDCTDKAGNQADHIAIELEIED